MALFTYCEGSHFISCLHLVEENIRPKRKDESNVRGIVIGLDDAGIVAPSRNGCLDPLFPIHQLAANGGFHDRTQTCGNLLGSADGF